MRDLGEEKGIIYKFALTVYTVHHPLKFIDKLVIVIKINNKIHLYSTLSKNTLKRFTL